MLAQTFLSFSYFKAAVFHFFSEIFKGKALTLFVHLRTSYSLFNPLQSGSCSQHSVKSSIMMEVTNDFPIPKSNEYYFIWHYWITIPFISVSSFSFLLSFYEHISLFSHSLYLYFTEFPRPAALLTSQIHFFSWHRWHCICWFLNLLRSDLEDNTWGWDVCLQSYVSFSLSFQLDILQIYWSEQTPKLNQLCLCLNNSVFSKFALLPTYFPVLRKWLIFKIIFHLNTVNNVFLNFLEFHLYFRCSRLRLSSLYLDTTIVEISGSPLFGLMHYFHSPESQHKIP